MNLEWIANPIYCNGSIACPGSDPTAPLLPQRTQIAFRIRLLFNAWEASACDGRQMAIADFDRMEESEERLRADSMDEESIRKIVDDVWNFIPADLTGIVTVPERALAWTQGDVN